jgi:hypothetical protein
VGSNPTLSAIGHTSRTAKGPARKSAKHAREVAVNPRKTVIFCRKNSSSLLPRHVVAPIDRIAPLITRCIFFALLLVLTPAAARAATGVLRAGTTQPLVGTPVTFTATLVPRVGAVGSINFGDGSPLAPVGPIYPVTVSHVYSAIGEYTATFTSDASRAVSLPLRVVLPAPRVPHGIIFSTVPLVSPVLAGDQTNITLTYRVVTPVTGFVSSAPDLVAVIDLLDDHERLVVRGDPVVIPYAEFQGGGVVAAHIPFAVPADARGRYHIRVYLRTPDLGGTVAQGDPAPLIVVGGPDPQPQVSASIHAQGSVEVGPQTGIGSTAGTAPSGAAQTTLNASTAVALLQPTYTFTMANTFNPTSLRIDPLFTLVPGAQAAASPNSQQSAAGGPAAVANPVPAGASPAPHYQDSLGPVTAQLPSLLFSGGESLRGLDSIVNAGGWNYQAALGYPTVASSTLGGQEGYLLDFERPFSSAQNLKLTFLQNIDDPYTFVPTNANQAVNSRAGGIQFDQTLFSRLTLSVGAAQSGATPELGKGPTQSDAADEGKFTYTFGGSSSLTAEYHNFGAQFAAGNGLGATSDSAGASTAASIALSKLANLALNYAHDFNRSAAAGSSTGGATFTLTTPQSWTFALVGMQDRSFAASSNSTTRNYTLTVAKSTASGTFNLNGNLATIASPQDPASNGVTRSGLVQYSVMRGESNIAFGLSATANQTGTPSANVGESVQLVLPIGTGHVAPNPAATNSFAASHGFELTLSGSNTNQPGATADTRDLIFGALLAYHLGPHVSLGLHALTDRHTDVIHPALTATGNTLRARMDFNL